MAKKHKAQNNSSAKEIIGKVIGNVVADARTWEDYTAYVENTRWLAKRLDRMKKKHAGEIIVVVEKKIGLSTRNPDEARSFVGSLVAPSRAYVRYISDINEALLL